MPRSYIVRTCSACLVLVAVAACNRTSDDRFTGYVEADLVYVSSPAAGVLESLAVKRGERVAAAAELFRLDTDIEELSQREAAARVAEANAQELNLRTGRRGSEIEALEQQLAQARASLASSNSQLARNEDLVRRGFVSAAQLDELRAARDRDAARVREIEAQLKTARTVGRPAEIAAAKAESQAAQAQLAQRDWMRQQKVQAAPVAALVYDVVFRVGERVAANAPVIALLPDGALKLRFYVPQAALPRISVGGAVAVHCDGCPQDLQARVTFIAPNAEFTPPVIYSNESRSKLVFLVEARPNESAAAALRPGLPVDVQLLATDKKS